MALGFGEAGSNIIAFNMSKGKKIKIRWKCESHDTRKKDNGNIRFL